MKVTSLEYSPQIGCCAKLMGLDPKFLVMVIRHWSVSMPHQTSRRSFMQQSLAAATAAAPLFIPRSTLAQGDRPAANDRVGVALIGCGRRGQSYIDPGLPRRTQIVAACDVHRSRAELAARKVNITDKDVVQDFRRVLDRQDVDAVMIATPEHWHALIAIAACQAGKHVYVEKPMTLCVVEGRRMVEAARKYRRIVQVGSQQRSTVP